MAAVVAILLYRELPVAAFDTKLQSKGEESREA
jgi:hypothetical protein